MRNNFTFLFDSALPSSSLISSLPLHHHEDTEPMGQTCSLSKTSKTSESTEYRHYDHHSTSIIPHVTAAPNPNFHAIMHDLSVRSEMRLDDQQNAVRQKFRSRQRGWSSGQRDRRTTAADDFSLRSSVSQRSASTDFQDAFVGNFDLSRVELMSHELTAPVDASHIHSSTPRRFEGYNSALWAARPERQRANDDARLARASGGRIVGSAGSSRESMVAAEVKSDKSAGAGVTGAPGSSCVGTAGTRNPLHTGTPGPSALLRRQRSPFFKEPSVELASDSTLRSAVQHDICSAASLIRAAEPLSQDL
jgi:hypothetical protein